jgi:hypothetical protein
MKKVYIMGALGSVLLYALAFWKNSKSYSWKSAQWRWTKSGIDTALVLLAAFYMPALLVAWAVIWVTRSINRRSLQITAAVILGIAFSAVGGVALEVLCILGIFSVDLLTGAQGIYGWWTKPVPKEFLPSLGVRNESANA